MNRRVRILILADEVWNDYIFGNGILTNWFTDFDAEFAEIFCSPGMPNNGVCRRYYQITDAEMARSMFFGPKAGHQLEYKETSVKDSKVNPQRQGIYGVMKNATRYVSSLVYMLRDFIWMAGRYDKERMKEFIDNFQPDVIFSTRMAQPKMLRLERIVYQLSNAPIIAFTADNEVGYRCYNRSPLFWIRRCMLTRYFKNNIHLYSEYTMFSAQQAEEYRNKYGLKTSVLLKCGVFNDDCNSKAVNSPIRMVYAGRLYCNRWKTLAEIGKALSVINKDGERMRLDIYTQDQLTQEQRAALKEEDSVYLREPITPLQLSEVYRNSDIALHVESFDKKYRAATRYSFSTKIIDLMASTCSVMAICWEKHAGYQYLKLHDAAFCISSYDGILPVIQKICSDPTLINKYAEKAFECGKKHHSRDIIQKQIKETFEKVLSESR